MAATTKYKTFQTAPDAATLTPIYICPIEADIGSVISTVLVCNRGSANTSFRLAIAIQNASDAVAQYFYYDHLVRGNRTFGATIGIALQPGDVLRAYSTNGALSFTVHAAELSSD